ncbi:23S rRNA (pseudouridine(1915)-N(3))-methyltransferase RlmH [Patescibacteria group bacterium]|nr:23S rRNA (pseudouridine(1915)-N(3))-methyltransferase RlmH [Patescibacteria group bacterium]
MYRLTIITVGKNKPTFEQKIIARYLKQIAPYAKTDLLELKEEKFRVQADQPRVLAVEAKKIRAHLSPDKFSILLTESGRTFDSLDFSRQLAQWSQNQTQHLQFIIGGPLGLDPKLKSEVDAVFSLSPLTFTHELAQILLLEQIYRAITIQNQKTYHY